MSTLNFDADIGWNRLLGPCFLPLRLTGAVYRDFLRKVLPELLQNVDLHAMIHFWFMLCGAPPHFGLSFPEFLNKVFSEQWIKQGGPTALWKGAGENCSLLFMIQNSVTSRSSNKEYRMEYRRFVLYL